MTTARNLAASFLLVLAFGATAQKAPDAADIIGPPQGQPLSGAALDEQTKNVASVLRCPVCQGLSVNDSPAEMAVSMKHQVRELVARGYGGVTRRHVEGLLATDAESRVALVDELLTDRTGDPARMLLLMATDESPAVRAAAISALGGSSSRELVTKALELATQDQDLRVGRLAEPIRERLR